MRFSATLIFACLLAARTCFPQTIDVNELKKGGLPLYRPALVGTSKDALINRIDEQALLKQGQKDAAIMFACTVKKDGQLAWSGTYRGTPDSKLLEGEVRKALAGVKFIPAVYNRLPVDAIFYGTVTFAVVDGKPRLRIFANQETAELQKESNFVGPQPFWGVESKFSGLHYPPDTPIVMDGVVEIQIKVDETGMLKDLKVTAEEPPFVGFGDAARTDFNQARFIPAFRDGKPVGCQIKLPVFYKTRT